MLKKIIVPALAALSLLAGCVPGYQRFETHYFDLFDTETTVVGYARSQKEFGRWADVLHEEMLRLHKLCDIYHDYEGLNNLKTVNDAAGGEAVKVDSDIVRLLLEGRRAYEESGGAVNIAMGAVLRVWHGYRESGRENPAQARLPDREELDFGMAHISMDDLVIDEAAGTVRLRDPAMSLDVGALAKGFAVQRAVEKAREAGFASGFVNAGGNVAAIGRPMDDRDAWSVGVQNPAPAPDGSQTLLDTLEVADLSVVSSGSYQRFYTVGGKSYHHIIDSATGMPADRYLAVTVLHPDSGTADFLSTALYILPREEGQALAERYGAEAIWVFPDHSYTATDGYKSISTLYDN